MRPARPPSRVQTQTYFAALGFGAKATEAAKRQQTTIGQTRRREESPHRFSPSEDCDEIGRITHPPDSFAHAEREEYGFPSRGA